MSNSPEMMLLDPGIVAKFWMHRFDDGQTRRERNLNGWVDSLLMDAMMYDADYALAIVEAIHEADEEQRRIEVFAAGPVEDLLGHHGPKVIDRIEHKARNEAAFARVLGGVWQNRMSDEIWDRVKAARDTSIWADARN